MERRDGLTRLTDPQKDVLRRIMQRQTVKQIAKELRVTPDAIEGRLRTARRILGCETSAEAARLLAEWEHGEIYQPSVYGPPVIADPTDDAATGVPDQPASGLHPALDRVRWPWPTKRHPRNDLSMTARIVWPYILIVALAVAVSLLLSSLAITSTAIRAIFR